MFEVTFLFKFFSLSSKSVLFTKLAVALLVTKFSRANLAAKFSAFSLLNFRLVVNSSWSWKVISFSNYNFCITVVCWTKLLTLSILFSTVALAVIVAKLVILSIYPLTSFVLALRVLLVAKLVITGIFYFRVHTSFLTT